MKVTRERVPKKPRLTPEDPTLTPAIVAKIAADVYEEKIFGQYDDSPCVSDPDIVVSSVAAITPHATLKKKKRHRGPTMADIQAPATLYITSQRPVDMTGFTEFQHKTVGLGKNQQGFKYIGSIPRETLVITKTHFAPVKEAKVKLTPEEKLAAKEARKNAPKPTVAEQLRLLDERTAARRAKLLAKLNTPELAGATA